MRYSTIQNPRSPNGRLCCRGVQHPTLQAAMKERAAEERQKGLCYDASQEAIYQSSLSLNVHPHTHTHTHTSARLYGGIQWAFPADQHKKGAGLSVEKPAQEEREEKKGALPHPLLFSSLIPSLLLSLSLPFLPHHPHRYPLPLAPSSAVLCRLDSRELLMDYG